MNNINCNQFIELIIVVDKQIIFRTIINNINNKINNLLNNNNRILHFNIVLRLVLEVTILPQGLRKLKIHNFK
jgi:hypothetical protein